jgi:hypothetical protein
MQTADDGVSDAEGGTDEVQLAAAAAALKETASVAEILQAVQVRDCPAALKQHWIFRPQTNIP